MDKKLIPEGYYCEDNEGHKCPYWNLREELPEQENSYCAFLGKCDYELNTKMAKKGIKVTYVNPKNREERRTEITHEHICMSMLWDGVKECEIKVK